MSSRASQATAVAPGQTLALPHAQLRNAKILIVDDDQAVAQVVARLLDRQGAQCIVASNGAEALERLSVAPDLLITDASMPGIDGFELVRRVRAGTLARDIPVLMISALNAPDDRIHGLEVGVNAHLAKPFDPRELIMRCKHLLANQDEREELRRQKQALARAVDERTRKLEIASLQVDAARKTIRQAQMETLERLAISAEYRDTDTFAHIQRVGELSALVALELGMAAEEVERIRVAARLHDIGKIGIPDAILLKPGRLTATERAIMQEHTRIGADILSQSGIPAIQTAEQIALTHHEYWNGAGYPQGLSREGIPLEGRICAVTDVFDALTSTRPYKGAMSTDEAFLLLQQGKGSQFEPRLVDILQANRARIETIQARFRDQGIPHLRRLTPAPLPAV